MRQDTRMVVNEFEGFEASSSGLAVQEANTETFLADYWYTRLIKTKEELCA
jgi:hypothetical protein